VQYWIPIETRRRISYEKAINTKFAISFFGRNLPPQLTACVTEVIPDDLCYSAHSSCPGRRRLSDEANSKKVFT
jgi:hypothetical protein